MQKFILKKVEGGMFRLALGSGLLKNPRDLTEMLEFIAKFRLEDGDGGSKVRAVAIMAVEEGDPRQKWEGKL